MKMITMWKEFYKEVIIPSWNWFKRYWKEYLLLALVIDLGVVIYYQIRFYKIYH